MESLDSGHTTVKTENSQPGVFFEKAQNGHGFQNHDSTKVLKFQDLTFVSDFRFRQKKPPSFPVSEEDELQGTRKSGGLRKSNPNKKPTSDFRMDFRIRLSYNKPLSLTQEKNSCCDL